LKIIAGNTGVKQHELLDIVIKSITAVIYGAETWEESKMYGRAKQKWLSTFLSLPNVIPSHYVSSDNFKILF